MKKEKKTCRINKETYAPQGCRTTIPPIPYL